MPTMPTLPPNPPDTRTIRLVSSAISAARVGLGAALLVAPRLSLRVAGMPWRDLDGRTRLLLRGFAVREVTLGLAMLSQAMDRVPSGDLMTLTGLTDAGDVVALLACLGGDRPLRRTSLMGIPVSVAVVAAWFWMRVNLPVED